MKCKALKFSNEGQRVECQAIDTNKCKKSRGQFKVTQYCWCLKVEYGKTGQREQKHPPEEGSMNGDDA